MQFHMLRRLIAGLCTVAVLLTMLNTVVKAEETVKVCDDLSPWPPFSYPVPAQNGKTTTRNMGSMVEFLDVLFKEIGLEYTLRHKPWKRCLEELKSSSGPDGIEIVINAGFSLERAKVYYVSKPIYQTTPGVFYSIDKYPTGLELNSLRDLKNFKICGVRGYSYQEYGLADSDLFSVSATLKKILKMVSLGRCEIVVSSIEPALGSKLYGDKILPDNVRIISIPQVTAATFHLLIARNSSRGSQLLERMNFAIDKLLNDGTWDRIMKKYQALMKAK